MTNFPGILVGFPVDEKPGSNNRTSNTAASMVSSVAKRKSLQFFEGGSLETDALAETNKDFSFDELVSERPQNYRNTF